MKNIKRKIAFLGLVPLALSACDLFGPTNTGNPDDPGTGGSQTETHTHSYDHANPVWTFDAATKKATLKLNCSGCEVPTTITVNASVKSQTAATCTSAGSIVYQASASLDGENFSKVFDAVTVSALGHTAKAAWEKDGTHHWHECSHEGCTEQLNKAEHSWDEGSVTTPATCTSEGVRTFTCTCGATKTEPISVLGHQAADEWSKDAVNHWHACTHNGCTEKLDSAAHTWDAGVITTAATCTTKGVKTFTCSVCQQTKTEEIPVLGHDAKTAWEKDANNHWHECSHEGCTEKLDFAAHTWDSGVETTPATCTTEGVKTYTCSVCGQTKTEPITELGHQAASEWSSDANSHWHACSHDPTEKLDLAQHSYGEVWQKDDASNHKKVCECGYKITEAHSWDDGLITTQPTHTSKGVITYTCSACGETKTEDIPVDSSIDHYSAVMPQADKRGMREYWDDGLGNANSISFVAPEGGKAITEKTLAEVDFNTAISDETDERVIYSINELNAAVTTFGDGNYPNLRAQKILSDYQYLDATTKAYVTNYSNFETGLRVLEAKGISGVLDVDEVKDLFDATLTKSVIADPTYGEVAKLVGPESGDGGWSYAKIDVSKLPNEGFIKFAIKSTTPVAMMLHNSEWNKCIDLTNGSVVNCEGVAPSSITLEGTWKEISIPCENLQELGSANLGLYRTNNETGYGINANNPAYITEIYCGSDFANPGSIIAGPKNWGSMTAEIGSEVDDTYGYLTTFKVLTTGQILQYKFNNTLVGDYDYVSVNIYCPVDKSDLFIQSSDWSGGIIYPSGDFGGDIITNNIGYLKLGWNEVKIPGAAFKNATWFAIVDTKAPTQAPVDSVYKMSLFKGGNFTQSEIAEAEELINTLPAVESLTAYDYYKIKNVENGISTIASVNSSLISNYSKFTAVKTAYDAKYYLIFDPATAAVSYGSGGETGTSATFEVSYDETYGSLLQINVTHVTSDRYFQLYFYTNWGTTKDANDKIHVSAKSPQETIGGTSQTFWYGGSNSDGVALKKDSFVELSGTMAQLTANEGAKSETTTITQSFTLQWYNGGRGDYTAVYYMTAIFGEIVD